MPNTNSAKKALRNSKRKYENNLVHKNSIKIAIRNLKKAVKVGAASDETKTLLSKVYSRLDKAVKINLMKKNTVSRKKSRLTSWLNKELALETKK